MDSRRERLADLCRRFRVDILYVFGSRAGEVRDWALEDLFEVERVDLVSLRDADPFLAANIIRGERLLCRGRHADRLDDSL